MKRQYALHAIAALAIAATACGGEKLGETPPEYAGSWVARRAGTIWRYEINPDGRFRAKPDDPNAGATTDGEWAVEDGKMLWSYTNSESRIKTVLAGADESNEIVRIDKDSFDLVESNGSRTRFVRARPPKGSAPGTEPPLPQVGDADAPKPRDDGFHQPTETYESEPPPAEEPTHTEEPQAVEEPQT